MLLGYDSQELDSTTLGASINYLLMPGLELGYDFYFVMKVCFEIS